MCPGVSYHLSYLHPVCPVCGFQLAAKIGGMTVVCVVCDKEFELVELLP